MNWLLLLAIPALILIYWRLSTARARRIGLLLIAFILTPFLTWAFLPASLEEPARSLIAIGLALLDVALIGLVAWIVRRTRPAISLPIGLVVLIGVFIVVKWPEAWAAVQQPFAPFTDLSLPIGAWLGLSFLLFRLLHVLLDRRKGQLPPAHFGELLTYALFPPSFIAGPIDRFPRFESDLDQAGQPDRFEFLAEGTWRILIGAFKKFVIADLLARLPLVLADYPAKTSVPALWLSLYAYGFMLYFDFSGYTDMALGLARLIGFKLPENFSAPYLKTNLARFWQSWHMTLSGWARDYVFFPLARTLRLRATWLPANGAALLCHLTTMIVIGVWHGFSWTFVAWGIWHGIGLFIVKLWGDFRRPKTAIARRASATRSARTAWRALPGWFLTFNYVMLGWVFFGARDLQSAFMVMGRLFGIK